MSINYGQMASTIPGNAGGVAFGPWTGAHLAPNVDLHNASTGLVDPKLASRAPTNPTPGPLVAQQSTFNNLPGSIQKAMQDLNIPGLQAQSARAALMDRMMGMPNVPIGFGGGAGGAGVDIAKQQAQQRAQQAAVWNAGKPNYFGVLANLPGAPAPMKPAGSDYRDPFTSPRISAPTVGQQPLNVNANIALPQY
jgi:hypothetical protein